MIVSNSCLAVYYYEEDKISDVIRIFQFLF